jgi:hypothetical protein
MTTRTKILRWDFPLDNPTNTDELICVNFQIPNRSEYRLVINSLISLLGKYGNWKLDGTRNATEIAQMFRRLMYDTFRYTDCEGNVLPFTCEDVALCFDEADGTDTFSEKLEELIQRIINNNNGGLFNDILTIVEENTCKPCTPITEEKAKVIPVNPAVVGCDKNIFWSQCVAYVDFWHTLCIDALEQIDALTSPAALAAFFVGAIPLLETLPFDELLETANVLAEFAKDTFLGYDNISRRQQIAGNLFCLGQTNCTFTFQSMYDAIQLQSDNELPTDDIFDIVALFARIASLEIVQPIVYYGMLSIVLKTAVTVQDVFGTIVNDTIVKLFIRQGENPDNDGWIILDCAPLATVDLYVVCDRYRVNGGDWIVPAGYNPAIPDVQLKVTISYPSFPFDLEMEQTNTGYVSLGSCHDPSTPYIDASANYGINFYNRFCQGANASPYQNVRAYQLNVFGSNSVIYNVTGVG